MNFIERASDSNILFREHNSAEWISQGQIHKHVEHNSTKSEIIKKGTFLIETKLFKNSFTVVDNLRRTILILQHEILPFGPNVTPITSATIFTPAYTQTHKVTVIAKNKMVKSKQV